jgi:predicted RNase H-like nuclease (RuvC/YqgF family)
MAKKPPKETPHLRVRIEPKLLAKLEKARDRNGRTLTGEIVDRLEQTFDTDETVAALTDQINELRQLSQPLMAEIERLRKEYSEVAQKLERSDSRTAEIVRKFQEVEASAKMVNALLGEDKQKSALLRRVVLEIAGWPKDWATNPAIRSDVEQRFHRSFDTQLGENAQ